MLILACRLTWEYLKEFFLQVINGHKDYKNRKQSKIGS